MIRYQFSQADWKSFILFPFISTLLLNYLKIYFGFGTAMLITFGIAVIFVVIFRKHLTSVVAFTDSFILLKKGIFKKEVKINYADINRITFAYNRFLDLWIYTADNKFKIPPPSNKLDKAKELFTWLNTKNPAIEIEITK